MRSRGWCFDNHRIEGSASWSPRRKSGGRWLVRWRLTFKLSSKWVCWYLGSRGLAEKAVDGLLNLSKIHP